MAVVPNPNPITVMANEPFRPLAPYPTVFASSTATLRAWSRRRSAMTVVMPR